MCKRGINPWFITGFIDAEGCFGINIYRDKKYSTGWRVKIFFEIHLHKKDYGLLEQIKKFFGVGNIYKNSDSIKYSFSSVKDVQVIKQHFYKYPLHTKKCGDFKLFNRALDLIQNKEHLTLPLQ